MAALRRWIAARWSHTPAAAADGGVIGLMPAGYGAVASRVCWWAKTGSSFNRHLPNGGAGDVACPGQLVENAGAAGPGCRCRWAGVTSPIGLIFRAVPARAVAALMRGRARRVPRSRVLRQSGVTVTGGAVRWIGWTSPPLRPARVIGVGRPQRGWESTLFAALIAQLQLHRGAADGAGIWRRMPAQASCARACGLHAPDAAAGSSRSVGKRRRERWRGTIPADHRRYDSQEIAESWHRERWR